MNPHHRWRQRLYIIIFESDTPAGRCFDTLLLLTILASLGVVMVDSIESVHARYHGHTPYCHCSLHKTVTENLYPYFFSCLTLPLKNQGSIIDFLPKLILQNCIALANACF